MGVGEEVQTLEALHAFQHLQKHLTLVDDIEYYPECCFKKHVSVIKEALKDRKTVLEEMQATSSLRSRRVREFIFNKFHGHERVKILDKEQNFQYNQTKEISFRLYSIEKALKSLELIKSYYYCCS